MAIAIPTVLNEPLPTQVGGRIVEVTMVSPGVYQIRVGNILLPGTFSETAVIALEKKLLGDDHLDLKKLRYRLRGPNTREGWVTG